MLATKWQVLEVAAVLLEVNKKSRRVPAVTYSAAVSTTTAPPVTTETIQKNLSKRRCTRTHTPDMSYKKQCKMVTLFS